MITSFGIFVNIIVAFYFIFGTIAKRYRSFFNKMRIENLEKHHFYNMYVIKWKFINKI